MESKQRVRRRNADGVLSTVIVFSFYVSLQAPGGFLHVSVYPINQFVWNRNNTRRFPYNSRRKELIHAESGECSASRTDS